MQAPHEYAEISAVEIRRTPIGDGNIVVKYAIISSLKMVEIRRTPIGDGNYTHWHRYSIIPL